jgi:hypothetical protein
MAGVWPWLAVAGIGALHGLNPATGWLCAAAIGVRSRDRTQALRALVPIAVGHGASVALVAAAVALGVAMNSVVVQALAGGLLVVAALLRLSGRKAAGAPARHAGLVLWSFMVSTAHGAGLMLVPALIPVCMGDTPAREITASGSLMLALAAVGVHTAAMLAVTGVIASGVCRGFDAGARLFRSRWPRAVDRFGGHRLNSAHSSVVSADAHPRIHDDPHSPAMDRARHDRRGAVRADRRQCPCLPGHGHGIERSGR